MSNTKTPIPRTVLVAEDEKNMRRILRAILEEANYKVYTAADGAEAWDLMKNESIDCIISDLRMPEMDGFELLQKVKKEEPALPFILISAHGSISEAVDIMKAGAFDFVTKPFDREQIVSVVEKAIATYEKGLKEVHSQYDGIDIEGYGKIIGESPAMRDIYAKLEDIAQTTSTVLITGETGTGKELLARAIHALSPRKDKPFIAVNCAAINPNLIESELLGHEKGAFTGAIETRLGRFELANEGTLFLDEIGEIPLSMQVKLLRAIQERAIERVGGVKTIRLDVRLICATNRDLAAEVREGNFREDLYYRINVIPIQIPPLRERREDIVPISHYLLEKLGKRLGKEEVKLEEEAIEKLVQFDWPGNVRQLENVIEQALVFCKKGAIGPKDLPPVVHPHPTDVARDEAFTEPIEMSGGDLKSAVEITTERLEKKMIRRALLETNGNRTKAAEVLGLSRRGLQYKLKKYELE